MADEQDQIQHRRSQLLDKRQEQLNDKRRRIEVLTQELESVIAGKWPAPITDTSVGAAYSSAEVSFSDSEASSSIVVSLPVSARKSARKMAKDPVAAAQGRREAKVLGERKILIFPPCGIVWKNDHFFATEIIHEINFWRFYKLEDCHFGSLKDFWILIFVNFCHFQG